MTTLTQQRFAFVSFKTMAARFREISGEEIQKLAGKNSKKKSTVKTRDVDERLEVVGRKQGS